MTPSDLRDLDRLCYLAIDRAGPNGLTPGLMPGSHVRAEVRAAFAGLAASGLVIERDDWFISVAATDREADFAREAKARAWVKSPGIPVLGRCR